MNADIIGLSGLITPSLDEMVHVAREMERQGFKLPLLIGGATTSRAHTAVKIAPHYSEPVVHVSTPAAPCLSPPACSAMKANPDFVAQHRAEYESLRKSACRTSPAVGLSRSRARASHAHQVARRRHSRRRSSPASVFFDNFPLATLRDFIDWTPFFHTWELKGVYPRILDHDQYGPQARQLFTEANALLDRIIAEKLLTARAVYGLFPADAAATMSSSTPMNPRSAELARFHFLRQQANREGNEPCRSLADFIAPSETGIPDHIGAFAVTSGIGLERTVRQLSRASTTTTTPSWPKPLPTALPKPSPSACTSACATSGAMAARKTSRPKT